MVSYSQLNSQYQMPFWLCSLICAILQFFISPVSYSSALRRLHKFLPQKVTIYLLTNKHSAKAASALLDIYATERKYVSLLNVLTRTTICT